MHAYASDSFFRGPKIYFGFGLAALAGASAFKSLAAAPPLLGYLNPGALSAGAIYGIAIFLYDRWLWAWLSNIQDLRGTWVGMIDSSHNGGSRVDCVVRIRQSWSRMMVELETTTSSSRTTMAALFQSQPGDRGLKYEFVTEPKGRAVDTLQIARGVCNLSLPDDNLQMSGNYYTGRGRMNNGEITLKRSSKKLLSYESAQRTEKQ